MTIADINGDGISDLFLYNTTSFVWKAYMGTGNGQFSFFMDGYIPNFSGCFSVNIDEDEKDEIVYATTYSGSDHVYYSYLKFSLNSCSSYLIDNIVNLKKTYSGDFNGDGKSDLMFLTTGNIAVFFGMGNVTNLQLPSDKISILDFDGDGKSDVEVLKKFRM